MSDDEIPDFQATLAEANRNRTTPPSRRRRFLKALLFLLPVAGGLWAYMKYEAGWLEVTRVNLSSDKFPVRRSFRILHLADFHVSEDVPLSLIEEAIVLGIRKQPDICFITGDFITTKLSDEDFSRYAEILGKLTDKIPKTFACLGNHDGGKWAGSTNGYATTQKMEELLKKSKVVLLQNEQRVVYVKGQPLTLVGLGDVWAQRCFPDKCLRKSKPNRSTHEPPTIVLSHNPDSKTFLGEHDWNLMLCGHTHGGQCKVPFLGFTPFAPVKDHDYVEGLHTWKERLIHITRGVGNLHGLRFNCRPQVSILEAKAP